MKKDTSRSIDLDALFAKSNNESVNDTPKEIIIETKTTLSSKESIPDFDAIVTEWSYRCDKGYPDMKNKSDMIKLQEILNEMGIKSPFKQVQLTELDKPKKKTVVKKVVKKVIKKQPTVDNSKEYGPGIPINTKDNSTIKAFKTKLSTINWENKSAVNKKVLDIFYDLGEKEQKDCVRLFQASTLDQYISTTWTYWKEFFNIKLDGMGRGEAMSVMAIQGASSGGTKEKDLITTNEGVWEIKEKPDSIRLAKSGAVGKFVYADEIRSFYKLLKAIKLDDLGNDNKLKTNIQALINNKEESEAILSILKNNFRGDEYSKTKNEDGDDKDVSEDASSINEDNFFERISNGGELPSGVIELHYQGFQALYKKIDVVKQNKDLLANAKLILRTPEFDVDPEFFINPKDATKIKNASGKKSTKVDITIAQPANEANVKFVYAMLNIMRHPFVQDPDAIPKDFKRVLDGYFNSGTTINGILWFYGGESKRQFINQPHLGKRKDWVIFGISQSQAKVKRRVTAENTKTTWMQKQLKLTK